LLVLFLLTKVLFISRAVRVHPHDVELVAAHALVPWHFVDVARQVSLGTLHDGLIPPTLVDVAAVTTRLCTLFKFGTVSYALRPSSGRPLPRGIINLPT
jgi:hypothetical protein